MKTILRSAFILFCFFGAATWTLGDPASASVTPASLAVPADETLGFEFKARGVQIYECRATDADPNKYEWTFKAPEAGLFDANGQKVGRHFTGPTWELGMGGKVVGHLKAKADAPDGKGIPWLLLDAVDARGDIMGKVRNIQRVDTVGGQAPSEPAEKAKAGQVVRVAYTATYKFYVAKD